MLRKKGATTRVADLRDIDRDLVQLARLALAGRPQDVQTYVTRMSRKYQKENPELGEALGELLKLAPTRQTPLRGGGVATIPVDRDTRLELLRHELNPELEHEPIWADAVRDQLHQIVSEHQRCDALRRRGLAPTKTAIFTGPPGVGKTLAARWLARQLDRPLLTLDLSAVMSSFLGRTGANVRHVLDYAKDVECVLLIDELDAVAKRRDDDQEVGELKRLVTVLLQEIDDWPDGGLLVAASNHHELLDPAIWRRFESHIEFPLPESEAVALAVRLFVEPEDRLDDSWLKALSQLLVGRSYSDIERDLKSLRRQSALSELPLADHLPLLVVSHMVGRTKAEQKVIAQRLREAGLSQRAVSDLTGLSRDTLRKMGDTTNP